MTEHERPADTDGAPEPDTAKTTSATAVRARRETARRLPPMPCGCGPDPWVCRCATDGPDDGAVDAYAAAITHLAAHGLTGAPFVPELRVLWRRGPGGRRIVRAVADNWAVA